MLVQLIVKILHYWGKKQKLRHVHELLSRDSVSTSLLSCDKAHMQQLLLFASVIRGGTTWVVHLIHSTWLEATLVSWRAWLQCVICGGRGSPSSHNSNSPARILLYWHVSSVLYCMITILVVSSPDHPPQMQQQQQEREHLLSLPPEHFLVWSSNDNPSC